MVNRAYLCISLKVVLGRCVVTWHLGCIVVVFRHEIILEVNNDLVWVVVALLILLFLAIFLGLLLFLAIFHQFVRMVAVVRAPLLLISLPVIIMISLAMVALAMVKSTVVSISAVSISVVSISAVCITMISVTVVRVAVTGRLTVEGLAMLERFSVLNCTGAVSILSQMLGIPAVVVLVEEFGNRDFVVVSLKELDFNVVVLSQIVLALQPIVDGRTVEEEVRDGELEEFGHRDITIRL